MKRNQRVFGDIDALGFVDDKLDEDRRAAYQAFLSQHPDALARVQLWQRQNDFLRAAFAPASSEPVPLWLRLDHIEVERETVTPAPVEPLPAARSPRPNLLSPAARPRRRTGSLRAIAGAVLLIAAGSAAMVATHLALTMPHGDFDRRASMPLLERPAGPVIRALDGFRTFAQDPTHPVEIAASDQPLLERWLMRRLMLPIHAPDLSDLGWNLLGGRLTPGDGGPAALLVFEGPGKQRLALYIQRVAGHAARAPTVEAAAGLSTASWNSGAIGYVVVSDRDLTWMSRNADLLRSRTLAAEAG